MFDKGFYTVEMYERDVEAWMRSKHKSRKPIIPLPNSLINKYG